MSSHATEPESGIYGLMAEFESAGQLVTAARRARQAGFRNYDAYSPLPLHELDEAMELKDNRVAKFTFIGGLLGCIGGFSLASWCSAVAFPLNIGGRPLISVPMFIPITFECTILLGGLTAAISMIVLNGLPRPYHPVFNVERFATASRSGFFLCIESEDPMFDRSATEQFLRELGPGEVSEIPR